MMELRRGVHFPSMVLGILLGVATAALFSPLWLSTSFHPSRVPPASRCSQSGTLLQTFEKPQASLGVNASPGTPATPQIPIIPRTGVESPQPLTTPSPLTPSGLSSVPAESPPSSQLPSKPDSPQAPQVWTATESASASPAEKQTPAEAAAFCEGLKAKYEVVPLQSWGSLPAALQAVYKEHGCDQYLVKDENLVKDDSAPSAEQKESAAVKAPSPALIAEPTVEQQSAPSAASAEKPTAAVSAGIGAVAVRTPELPAPAGGGAVCKGGEQGVARAQCEMGALRQAWYRQVGTMRKFCDGIRGKARDVWPSWESAHCPCYDEATWTAAACKEVLSPFSEPTAAGEGIYSSAKQWVDANPPVRKDAGKPVIALLVSVVASKKVSWATVEECPLFKIALSTILDTLEQGFEYWVFVGHDAGDPYFDKDTTRKAVLDIFNKRVATPAEAKGVTAVVRILKFNNPARKPGPMFNFLSEAAMLAGADFLFRINDDTQVASKFASILVQCLARMDPPFLGVCGPSHTGGGTHILTHDFVHRTHLFVFPTHYPAVLTDWFLDDWISMVYTPSNTVRVPEVKVHHKTTATRYVINRQNQKFLTKEVKLGGALTEAYRDVYSALTHYDPASSDRPLILASGALYTVKLPAANPFKPYKPSFQNIPKPEREVLEQYAAQVAARKQKHTGRKDPPSKRRFRRMLRMMLRRRR